MLKTILTATDGSKHAETALDLAIDLATKYGSKLVIMHVMGSGPVPEELRHIAEIEHVADAPEPDKRIPLTAASQGSNLRSQLEHENHQVHEYIGQQLLDRALETTRKRGISEIVPVLAEGDPASSILENAERHQADMIVLGSRGLSDLKALVVGSVSHKVSHLASCTCVCVK